MNYLVNHQPLCIMGIPSSIWGKGSGRTISFCLYLMIFPLPQWSSNSLIEYSKFRSNRKTRSSGEYLGPWPPCWFAAQPGTLATYLRISPIPKANILLTYSHLGLASLGSDAEGCLVSLIPSCVALGHALLAKTILLGEENWHRRDSGGNKILAGALVFII